MSFIDLTEAAAAPVVIDLTEEEERFVFFDIFTWLAQSAYKLVYTEEDGKSALGRMQAPAIHPCMDDYGGAQGDGGLIDRAALVKGDRELHLVRGEQKVLTVKRVVKNGEPMLGVFAASNIEAGSILALYLGREVPQKGAALHEDVRNNLLAVECVMRSATTFIQRTPQRDDYVKDEHAITASKREAFHLAHFVNSCDEQVEGDRSPNVRFEPEFGQLRAVQRIPRGEELLCLYGDAYYDDPQEPSDEEDGDSDEEYVPPPQRKRPRRQ